MIIKVELVVDDELVPDKFFEGLWVKLRALVTTKKLSYVRLSTSKVVNGKQVQTVGLLKGR